MGCVTIAGPLTGPRPGGCAGGSQDWLSETGPRSDATHRLMIPAAEVHRQDHMRAPRKAVIHVCTDPRALSGCQARSEWAQQHHLACCLGACGMLAMLAHERPDRHLSLGKRKRRLSCQGCSYVLPVRERLRNAAQPLTRVEHGRHFIADGPRHQPRECRPDNVLPHLAQALFRIGTR
jgi:hypothetical protein